ncbi:MAG: hypothetical protein KIS72_06905, partial [Luteimonas sp.]|nr:hypothetical protein [Luteimonas sp.]
DATAGAGDGGGAGAALTAPVQAMGLSFPSPLVLAAGFDRHGRLLPDGAALGLGGVETGSHWTVAEHPPPLHRPLSRSRQRAPGAGGARAPRHGLNLVKPPMLDWARAEHAFRRAIGAWQGGADYLVLNPGRGCPSPWHFVDLVAALSAWCGRLPRHRPLPLVAKLPASWVEGDGRVDLARRFVAAGADGLLLSAEGAIATACRRIAELAGALGPGTCLVSVGGIDSVREAQARLQAGARLLQVHRAVLVAGARQRRLLAAIAGLRPPA